ncbi:MAG: ABC transporter ATP-binding protein [Cyanobacteria bacterium P01_G01_bin.54]
MATLELQNLRKQFAPQVIPVKDISLTIHDGEFLTLLGPSGCGKSTLLRLIAGLEQPTQGQVLVGGNPVTNLSPGDRNMAMVFQSYALYPHMTVAENIAASLKIRKVPIAEIQTRVATVAQTLGLTHLRDRKPGKLSGGQRQRVALARALVRNPEVFLLDEPLSNLDALLREQVRAELQQIFNEQNKPVVYVTHDQTEAMTLSSKVAVLLDGRVQQLDPPERIYTHPANKFVAGFVGSPQMNLWSLNCDGKFARCGDYRIPLPELPAPPAAIDLGIRPEDVRLAKPEETPTVAGNVILTENFGREQLVTVQISSSSDAVRVLIPPDQTWNKENTGLVLEPQKCHWFDAQTGDRLVE